MNKKMSSYFLPNKRWLLSPLQLPKWWQISEGIDKTLESLGLSLDDDGVYFLFNCSPQKFLESKGSCWIGKAYIGPLLKDKFQEDYQPFEQTSFSLKTCHHFDWLAQEVLRGQWSDYPTSPNIVDLSFEDLLSWAMDLSANIKGQFVMPTPWSCGDIRFILRLTRGVVTAHNMTLSQRSFFQDSVAKHQFNLQLKIELFLPRGSKF